MHKTVFLLLLVALLVQCKAQSGNRKSAVTPTSSLCGTVVEKRGNQMPGPGRAPSAGRPVVREVAIFSLLTQEQVTSDDAGFITDLKSNKPVQTVQSGKDGTFCFSNLPAGRYSVLVREPKGWYTNLSDTQNHLNPVTVTAGETARMTIQITHQAAF